jgi:hypothetical protein
MEMVAALHVKLKQVSNAQEAPHLQKIPALKFVVMVLRWENCPVMMATW